MKINVHAGHNPDGKNGCGAVGIVKESTEARRIKDAVNSKLRQLGHTVYDCTVDDGKNASDVLRKIVAKCNANDVDLDVSIHLNGGRNDYEGDEKTGGTEVFIYSKTSAAAQYAVGVADAIADLGYTKRKDNTYPVAGVKVRPNLYVLKNTNAPAMLVECFFTDDKDDVELFDVEKMADAIVYGITGQRVEKEETVEEDLQESEGATTGTKDELYRVQVGAYSVKANADRMKKVLIDAGFEAIIVKV
ncbi:MAG: N-acetylmuramoyl-L-alanine amidase [Bacteroidales bacterium]|nr:N-acetylmuramoyl-L-alanine amidase [Bacteroidales bacterium]